MSKKNKKTLIKTSLKRPTKGQELAIKRAVLEFQMSIAFSPHNVSLSDFKFFIG